MHLTGREAVRLALSQLWVLSYSAQCVYIVLRMFEDFKVLFKYTVKVIKTCLALHVFKYFYFTDFHLSPLGLEHVTHDGEGITVYPRH